MAEYGLAESATKRTRIIAFCQTVRSRASAIYRHKSDEMRISCCDAGRSMLLQMPIQPCVQPAFRNQLTVLALLGDPPAIEYQHPVGLFHR